MGETVRVIKRYVVIAIVTCCAFSPTLQQYHCIQSVMIIDSHRCVMGFNMICVVMVMAHNEDGIIAVMIDQLIIITCYGNIMTVHWQLTCANVVQGS